MRSVLISRFAHTCTGVGCPAGIAPKGTVAGLWSETLGHHASTFLHPFAPPELPGFNATMGALTPARWYSWTEQVSLLHSIESSEHSVSNHPLPPRSFGLVFSPGLPCVTVLRRHAPENRVMYVLWASPLGCRLAATKSRIEFVIILRTVRSPPVASHPASRRRSHLRLRSSDQTSAGTCTLPIQRACRRTPLPARPAGEAVRRLARAARPILFPDPCRLVRQVKQFGG